MNFVAVTSSSAGLLSWIILIGVLVSVALTVYCVFTIHRNPYFNELQKIGWLLLSLGLPIMGAISWLVRARHEKKVRENPEKYGVIETPSVTEFAAKLVPVYDGERSPATSHTPLSSSKPVVRETLTSTTVGKTTRFAPHTDFVQASETSDTADNPHLSGGEDGGPRVLRF